MGQVLIGQVKPKLSQRHVTHWMVEGIIIDIKVRGVHRPAKLRDVGSCAGCKPLPIHTFKERVVPEVIQSTTTKPLLLAAQQLSDQVLGTGRHIRHIRGELEVVLWVKEKGRSG